MHSTHRPSLAHLLHLLGSASALSLSNFDSTSAGSLSSACAAVFTASIPACTVSDFEPAPACSQACLLGLEQLNSDVAFACAAGQGSSVNSQSLLGSFVAGQGIQRLCNVVVKTTTVLPPQTTTAATVLPPVAATPDTSALVPAAATEPSTAAGTMGTEEPSTTMTIAAPQTSAPASSPSPSQHSTMTTSASKTTAKSASKVVSLNPSKPTCTDGGTIGDSGSPFDSFSDQLCEKSHNGAASLRLGWAWRALGLGAAGWAVAWAVS